MIPPEDKERVIQATDFVGLVAETVQLHEKTAGDFWGRCPFHEERTESFHITTDRGLFYCFGCGAKGDVIDYVEKRENLDFIEAVRYLADRAHIELHERGGVSSGPGRGRLVACLEEAQRHFAHLLLKTRDPAGACERARRYLGKRDLGHEVALRWGLGYSIGRGDLVNHLLSKGFSRREIVAADLGVESPNGLRDRFYNRVMFPIRDVAGSVIGFGGRVIDDSLPKYLNSRDTSLFHKRKNLYALERAKASITATGRAVIVEGYTDAIALHEAGVTNAAAILGTALTEDHLKALDRFRPREIVSLLDGDEAGRRAAAKMVALIAKTKARLSCVILPEGKDPAEYIAAYGPQAMMARISEASDLVLFVLERNIAEARSASVGERQAILDEICSMLAPLADQPLAISPYSSFVADAFSLDEAQLMERIRRAARAGAFEQAGRIAPSRETPTLGREGPETLAEPLPDLDRMSGRERSRILSERELLSMLAAKPEAFSACDERIRSLTWADPRHGRIARVLLDAASASPSQRIARARSIDPYAPRILAASEFDRRGARWGGDEASFMVDQVEAQSLDEELRVASAELHAAEIAGDEGRIATLMARAQQLRSRMAELEASVRTWNEERR